jgi:ketosteroid isomerase-like protein
MSNTATEVDREQVFSICEDEAAAIETGDIDKYLSLLSGDAVFMPPNVPIKAGDELRAWLRDFLDDAEIHYTQFEHRETIVRDDLAYHVYTCRWTAAAKSGGESRSYSFKGMHVLRRGQTGAWRISRNIWNTDPELNQQS